MTLMSERVSGEVQLEDDPRQRSTINVESFVDEQEWRLYREVSSAPCRLRGVTRS